MARAIGSYPAGHKFKSYCRYHIWPHRQAVKTSPFHGEVSGSNPLGVTNLNPSRNDSGFFVDKFSNAELNRIIDINQKVLQVIIVAADDIANVLLFLTSNESKPITGQIMVCDYSANL